MPKTARSETGDPFLLTPGPLTTSASVKRAMVHDWGSRDAAFVRFNREVLESITPSCFTSRPAIVTFARGASIRPLLTVKSR